METRDDTLSVGILLFDEVEVLDFAGPFEVFSVSGRSRNQKPFDVFTVGVSGRNVKARNELEIVPTWSMDDAPEIDLLVIPGGYGTRPLLNDSRVIEWIKKRSATASLTLSVCTGSLLLAKAGLLAGHSSTTHHGSFDTLASLEPETNVIRGVKLVDNGDVITSGGVAAGIEMALHVVARICGPVLADETAAYIEYDWRSAERDGVIA